MLSASIYSGKRFFMKQAHKPMLCRNLLHNFHCQLVMVCRDVCCCIDRGKFMLRRGNFVMFCLCQNPQLPEFLIEFFHISGNPWLDYSEVMIVHLLSLGRLRAKKSTSRKSKIPPLFIHFFCNKKIFLLRPYGCADTFHIVISKQMKNANCLLI